MTKKWIGSNECDFCGRKPTEMGDTASYAVIFSGQWAFMCRPCWLDNSRNTGQEYDAKTLVKIRNLGTMTNTLKHVFTAYGHKVHVLDTHVKITNLDTGYDITCTYDQVQYHIINKVMPTVGDLLVNTIKKLIA